MNSAGARGLKQPGAARGGERPVGVTAHVAQPALDLERRSLGSAKELMQAEGRWTGGGREAPWQHQCRRWPGQTRFPQAESPAWGFLPLLGSGHGVGGR